MDPLTHISWPAFLRIRLHFQLVEKKQQQTQMQSTLFCGITICVRIKCVYNGQGTRQKKAHCAHFKRFSLIFLREREREKQTTKNNC